MARRDYEMIEGQLTLDMFLSGSTKIAQRNIIATADQGFKSVSAYRIIKTALAQIKPTDTEFKPYILTNKQYMEFFGVSRQYISRHAEAIKEEVRTSAITLPLTAPNGATIMTKINWVSFIAYDNEDEQFFALKINSDLAPHLIRLVDQGNYYQIAEYIVAQTKNLNAGILFEYINEDVRVQNNAHSVPVEGILIDLPLEILKRIFQTEVKEHYESGRRSGSYYSKLLLTAIKEVERISSIFIDATPYKKGKEIVGYHLRIYNKFRLPDDYPPERKDTKLRYENYFGTKKKGGKKERA